MHDKWCVNRQCTINGVLIDSAEDLDVVMLM